MAKKQKLSVSARKRLKKKQKKAEAAKAAKAAKVNGNGSLKGSSGAEEQKSGKSGETVKERARRLGVEVEYVIQDAKELLDKAGIKIDQSGAAAAAAAAAEAAKKAKEDAASLGPAAQALGSGKAMTAASEAQARALAATAAKAEETDVGLQLLKAMKAFADDGGDGGDGGDVEFDAGEEGDEEGKENSSGGKSEKAIRRANRLSVAMLKQLVEKPHFVELHDVTAEDPRLLVHLKGVRNTVPVPSHWSQKRKYLAYKRGSASSSFQLPKFIADTGIQTLREHDMEAQERGGLRGTGRDRMRPKMGRIEIDYQVLHDAFFRFQTKPKLSKFGELYYEGKEHEVEKGKDAKPGKLSRNLRVALGMMPATTPAAAEGGGTGGDKDDESFDERIPPPWLINMQRYGPPPSYPSLRIPGLNCPIPAGCSFGYHAGGWGKPPVDEHGLPIYGDVFSTEGGDGSVATAAAASAAATTAGYARASASAVVYLGKGSVPERSMPTGQLWGALEEEEYEDEEDEEDEEEGEGEKDDDEEEEEEEEEEDFVDDGTVTPAPGALQLRKRDGTETPVAPQQLYRVLKQKKAGVGGGEIFGSAHTYDVGGSGGGGTTVSLNPEELEGLSDEVLQAKLAEANRARDTEKAGVAAMVAAEMARRNKKEGSRKRKRQ